MKKSYQHPHVEISKYASEDILTTSNTPWVDGFDFGLDDPYEDASYSS